MKITVAPNSFKGCLSSIEVANYIQKGINNIFPHVEVIKIPLADGGDGTLDVLVREKNGVIHEEKVRGPLFDWVNTRYGVLPNGVAVIELALIAGIELIPKEKRNPTITTTYGVGELISKLRKRGVKEVIIGIGGSATCDCGAGILSGMGVKFINKCGNPFIPTGGNLTEIKNIILPAHRFPKITILADVSNPLLGDEGVKLYLPQKGATEGEMKIIYEGVKHFTKLVKTKITPYQKWTGAAGGVGFGLSLVGGKLVGGAKYIMKEIKFDAKVEGSKLIITGEGELNFTTKYHKTVWEVILVGKKKNIPIVIVTGKVGGDVSFLHFSHILKIFPLSNSFNEKVKSQTPKKLQQIAKNLYPFISETKREYSTT